jgi:hypothetical protein
LAELDSKNASKLSWLNLGADFRSRFEYRENDIRRRELLTDSPILLRTRFYAGFDQKRNPFKLVIEFEDAFKVNGLFPDDNRDVNRFELIQAYAGLQFDHLLRADRQVNPRPIFLRFGRQAFEFLDRRLIGLNKWRNTTNNFVGFRGAIGNDRNAWSVDLLALRPITRLTNRFDERDKNKAFVAAIGHWRMWSRFITIEPYYLGLFQEASANENLENRRIHSPGLRVYGKLFKRSLHYEFSHTQQFGNSGTLRQQAFGITSEIGYSFKKLWKMKIGLFYGFISGDQNPNDQVNNRFERFYGFARPWSADDYIIPENVSTPKIRLEFQPAEKLKFDIGYSLYWLASKTDRFANLLGGANNRDPFGLSGSFLGHGPDFRIQIFQIPAMETIVGYSYFQNGEFVLNRQQSEFGFDRSHSNFLYFEFSFNLVEAFMN